VSRKAAIDDVEGFEPCRVENCKRLGVHPAHDDSVLCPKCAALAIKMPRKRYRCSVCPWRGKFEKKPKTKKAVQLHA